MFKNISKKYTNKVNGPDTVLVITGAPRTGTHLANALVCKAETVQPLLTEASFFISGLMRDRGAMLRNLKVHPGNYFSGQEDADRLTAGLLDTFTAHLFARYQKPVVVLRGPSISVSMSTILKIVPYCKPDYKVLLMVRDPRDIFCSLKVWNRKKMDRVGEPLAENLMDYLVETIRKNYSFLDNAGVDEEVISLWRYEDVARAPGNFTQKVSEFLGVEMAPMEKNESWSNQKADLSAANTVLGDAITPLYNEAVTASSIGRYAKELSAKEIDEIEQRLQSFMEWHQYID